MDRQRGHLEAPLGRPLVQRLDVTQNVLEAEAAGVDLALRERVEHERVIRVRTMSKANQYRLYGHPGTPGDGGRPAARQVVRSHGAYSEAAQALSIIARFPMRGWISMAGGYRASHSRRRENRVCLPASRHAIRRHGEGPLRGLAGGAPDIRAG